MALRNIHASLKEGCFYIFDILNLETMTDEVIKADNERMSDEKTTADGSLIRTVRRSSIDRINGYITAEEDITICGHNTRKSFQHTCTLKIYAMHELKELLSRNGFTVIEQHKTDAYTFQKDEAGTSILTVAQKKG